MVDQFEQRKAALAAPGLRLPLPSQHAEDVQQPLHQWTDPHVPPYPNITSGTVLVIQVTTAKMPTSCWGAYVNIKLLEVDRGLFSTTKRRVMPLHIRSFSQGKGVLRTHSVSERNHLGSTPRCAAGREIKRLLQAAIARGEVPHVLSCASGLPLATKLFRDAVAISDNQCVVVDGPNISVESCDDAVLLALARGGVRLLAGAGA